MFNLRNKKEIKISIYNNNIYKTINKFTYELAKFASIYYYNKI